MKIENAGNRIIKKEMRYTIISLPYISGIAPVKIPMINTIINTAKAAGKNEIMRGTSNLAVLRSADVAFIKAVRVLTNHIRPASGKAIRRKIIK